ncbi:MAG: phenylalanine--tRNA ligase subunit alpha, partial [Ruminococcaceae bacterium]|nr:phenylalanine--tRNA ligase subunit alpha [Oscillospiraceae bacterium]
MKEHLESLRVQALGELEQAKSFEDLEALRIRLLGKKGELTAILKQMGKLSAEERPIVGQVANTVRAAIEEKLEARRAELQVEALNAKLEAEALDVTVPGKPLAVGHRHPMNVSLEELKNIFIGMGFAVDEGNEIEYSTYNFDRLNTDEGHPAREWTDTFYLDENSEVLLRTHTSPMEPRIMETHELPIRYIVPGRCYRKDEVDATHSPMFHQMEGLVVDKNITFADLKGALHNMAVQLYGPGTVTRFRPHHFPFTEPSCEMDVQCHKCGGKGCPTCKGEGWIELLGAGTCNPLVLKASGIDPDEYSGWAFGMGLERAALQKFKIDDLRLIYENDVRFLEQF